MPKSKQKDTRITRLTFAPTILDKNNLFDVMENQKELQEQLEADMLLGGINIEIKERVIEELIERLNGLIPNIIIATHE